MSRSGHLWSQKQNKKKTPQLNTVSRFLQCKLKNAGIKRRFAQVKIYTKMPETISHVFALIEYTEFSLIVTPGCGYVQLV